MSDDTQAVWMSSQSRTTDGHGDLPPIFHITEPVLWQQAIREGSFTGSTRGATLAEIGFVHCSFAHQVETVANALYADAEGDLLLLEIDPARLTSEIRVENSDGGAGGFPHVYGPIPREAVVTVHDLTRFAGRWTMAEG